MCCFEESQIRDTEKPIADSLGLEVTDVNATSWTQFGGEAARRRFLASVDGAWNIEYVIAVLGIQNTSNTLVNLKDDTFVKEIGESISVSMNVEIVLISTRNVSMGGVLSNQTLTPAPSENPTLKPTTSTFGETESTSADTTIPIIVVVVVGIGFVTISICALKFDYKAIKMVHAKPLNENSIRPISTNI